MPFTQDFFPPDEKTLLEYSTCMNTFNSLTRQVFQMNEYKLTFV